MNTGMLLLGMAIGSVAASRFDPSAARRRQTISPPAAPVAIGGGVVAVGLAMAIRAVRRWARLTREPRAVGGVRTTSEQRVAKRIAGRAARHPER